MAVTDPGFNPSENSDVDQIKRKALELEEVIKACCPAGRHQSIALTHLETASMFAVKGNFV